MLQYISAAVIAAEAKMVRTAFKGTILFVEGSTDIRIYRRFIDPQHCYMVVAHGKENAIGAVGILEGAHVAGIVAIVDADHWHLSRDSDVSVNVLLTDVYDVELLAVRSKAFERVVAEFVSDPKLEKFQAANGNRQLREILLQRCAPLGYLRLISRKNPAFQDLKFEGLNYKNVVEGSSLEFDIPKLVNTVASNTARPGLNPRALLEEVERVLQEEEYDPFQLCCGHDVLELFAIGLRRALGNQPASSRETLELALRLAFEWRDFEVTELFTAIRNWEENNAPYKVLAA